MLNLWVGDEMVALLCTSLKISQVIVGCTLQQRDNSTLPIAYSISFYASR